jgi:hypothetical protein
MGGRGAALGRRGGPGAQVMVLDARGDQVLDRGRVDVADDHGDDHGVTGDGPDGVAVQPGPAVAGTDRGGGAVRLDAAARAMAAAAAQWDGRLHAIKRLAKAQAPTTLPEPPAQE